MIGNKYPKKTRLSAYAGSHIFKIMHPGKYKTIERKRKIREALFFIYIPLTETEYAMELMNPKIARHQMKMIIAEIIICFK